MVDPKSSNLGKFFMIEDTDTVWWSEQTMSDHNIWKILETLLFTQPAFKWMFEHMCCDFDDWRKFLELPISKLINDTLNKLQKNIVKSALPTVWLSLC